MGADRLVIAKAASDLEEAANGLDENTAVRIKSMIALIKSLLLGRPLAGDQHEVMEKAVDQNWPASPELVAHREVEKNWPLHHQQISPDRTAAGMNRAGSEGTNKCKASDSTSQKTSKLLVKATVYDWSASPLGDRALQGRSELALGVTYPRQNCSRSELACRLLYPPK